MELKIIGLVPKWPATKTDPILAESPHFLTDQAAMSQSTAEGGDISCNDMDVGNLRLTHWATPAVRGA